MSVISVCSRTGDEGAMCPPRVIPGVWKVSGAEDDGNIRGCNGMEIVLRRCRRRSWARWVVEELVGEDVTFNYRRKRALCVD